MLARDMMHAQNYKMVKGFSYLECPVFRECDDDERIGGSEDGM